MNEWTFKTTVGDRAYSLLMTLLLALFAACSGLRDQGGACYFFLVAFLIFLALFVLGGGDETRVDQVGIHPRRWYVRRRALAWSEIADIDDGLDYNRGSGVLRRWAIDVIRTDGGRYRLPAPVRRSRVQIREDATVIRSIRQRGAAGAAGPITN